jgi:calcineurin-like phosphoesterase family protein
MQIWLTSDTHFNHYRMVEERGFASVEEMNANLIDNINTKVDKRDYLYHLGDFALCPKKYIPSLRERIRCKTIHLIKGNHDRVKDLQGLFISIRDVHELRWNNIVVWLSHFAHRTWGKSHYGAIHAYGHSHGNLADDGSRSMDVGVDTNDFKPYNLNEVVERLASRPFRAVDHHIEGEANEPSC